MIIEYIRPACKRLNVKPHDFIRPETISLLGSAVVEGKYSMFKFKQFITAKENDYFKDVDTFGNPYIFDDLELMSVLKIPQDINTSI